MTARVSDPNRERTVNRVQLEKVSVEGDKALIQTLMVMTMTHLPA